jgi:Family of unknown function (DUF6279)
MITMSRFISKFRLVALIIVATLLTGCSAIKLAYNQAPDLTYWWLDGYFDFNEQQTPKVRDELTRLLAWHRSSELPKTADLLGQAAQLMAGEVSSSQACRMYEQGRGLLDNVTNQALPFMAEIAPTLTPDQILHMKRKYEKNAEAFNRDYIAGSAANRDAKRLKQAIERSEMFYGKLDDPQIAVIKQALASSSFDAAATLKERQRRQKELMDLLSGLAAAKASKATSVQSLRAYIQRAWEAPDPVYRAYVQRLTNEGCTSFANVHASTTAAQRAYAVKVLKGYEADLRTLASAR